MSKPSEGITLKPVKWSELVKKESVVVTAPPPVAASKYVPPTMRAVEAKKEKELSADDLGSAKLFPSLTYVPTKGLPPMLPTTTGASWSQIRNRIEGGMKEHIVEKIEAQKQSEEDRIRNENQEDPYQMTIEQRDAKGWKTLIMTNPPREANIVDGYFFTEEVPLWDGCPITAPPEILGYK
jgi:hypothetical protein